MIYDGSYGYEFLAPPDRVERFRRVTVEGEEQDYSLEIWHRPSPADPESAVSVLLRLSIPQSDGPAAAIGNFVVSMGGEVTWYHYDDWYAYRQGWYFEMMKARALEVAREWSARIVEAQDSLECDGPAGPDLRVPDAGVR